MFAHEWFRPWIKGLGEDPLREGLISTAPRMATALEEMLRGYKDDPAEHFQILFIEPKAKSPVIVSFPFYSLCEHHMLPFFGDISIEYKPHGGRIVGLSKIPRGCHVLAARLQTQERLTAEIADSFYAAVCPVWVKVVIDARHLCMEARGAGTMARTITEERRGENP